MVEGEGKGGGYYPPEIRFDAVNSISYYYFKEVRVMYKTFLK